ncbi:MAG: acyl-CoA thioesterase [Muriicola sp.]|nr:acyl-CoA thioesterase [Muriicola sp.]
MFLTELRFILNATPSLSPEKIGTRSSRSPCRKKNNMVFEMKREVRQEDLDELDHVNNVRYVQWIQDISKAHWEARAPQSIRDNVLWVVKQHKIEYRNAAKLGDTVVMKTYIDHSSGAISTRVVEMFDSKTDLPLLKSETQWCLLNTKTLKPMRISEEISSVFIQKANS